MKQRFVMRIKTGLFITAVIAMLLGPVVVYYSNQLVDDYLQTDKLIQSVNQDVPIIAGCVPSVGEEAFAALDEMVVGDEGDAAISKRMEELFRADQGVRMSPIGLDLQALYEEDSLRRIEVLDYIKNGHIHSPTDLVYASFIFQHGDCAEHYLFANRLAELAVDAGYEEARWIYAATLDRYLMRMGEPQKYGTQYTLVDGVYKLYQVDPNTTDEERAEYHVPSLSEAMRRESEIEVSSNFRQQWLETWWLVWIGAGFAALSAFIAVAAKKMNARRGWVILAISLAVYVLGGIGHYLQIDALKQGITDLQGKTWNLVNALLLVLWLVLALFEVVRLEKKSLRTNSNHPR